MMMLSDYILVEGLNKKPHFILAYPLLQAALSP
jgi:hypothetical protein